MIKTAVVILNWNGLGFLQKFIPGVVRHTLATPDTAVIVADNGSTDGSIDWLQTHHPEVQLIALDRNYGFTGGYNKALQQVQAQYYVLLNSDVDVTPQWLDPLIAAMDADHRVAACMPKLRTYDAPQYFEHAGAAGGYIDRDGYPFCRGRILELTEQDEGQYDTPAEVFWASGASLFIRADRFHEAGGFDDDFFAHMEEIDLCWRLQRLGYTIMCIPQSVVYHVGGGMLPRTSARKLYLNYRNNLLMLYKNLPIKHFKRRMLRRMLLDGVSAIMYLASLKFSFFKAVFKAHMSFYKMRKAFKLKRQILMKCQMTPIVHGYYPKSIVLKYFKSHKKLRFSDLEF